MRKLPPLVMLSTRVFLRLVLLALPFLAGAALVWFTMLGGHDINYYLAEHPPEWRHAKLLAVILGVELRAAGGLAARALAVRGAQPGIRRRQSRSGPRDECAHDSRTAHADRDSAVAVVAAAHRGDRRDHLVLPRDLGRRARLGGH